MFDIQNHVAFLCMLATCICVLICLLYTSRIVYNKFLHAVLLLRQVINLQSFLFD